MLVVIALAVWTTARFGVRGGTLVAAIVFGCALVASVQGKPVYGTPSRAIAFQPTAAGALIFGVGDVVRGVALRSSGVPRHSR